MPLKQCPFHQAALQSPSAIAIASENLTLTYKECDNKIARYVKALSSFNIRPRQKVALLMTSSIFTVLAFFALLRLHVKILLLSPKDPQDLMLTHLNRVGCKFVISEEAFSLPGSFIHIMDKDLTSSGPLCFNKPSLISCGCISTLMLTSGSSGYQKICCHSLQQLFFSAQGSLGPLKLTTFSRYHLSLPLYHVGGLAIILRSLLARCTLSLSSMPKEHLIPWIQENKISHLSLVITQLKRLLSSDLPCPPELTMLLLGGSPCPHELILKGVKLGFPMMMSYGLTEMSSLVTAKKIESSGDNFSSGLTLHHRKCALDGSGEILVKGKTLFKGYFEKNTATKAPLSWFYTGDLGTINSKGELIVIGRKHRMIISGGENIHPEEIEKLLLSISGIEKACVIGVKDPWLGSKAIAFIQTLIDATTLSSCLKLLEKSLPRYKIPKEILPWPPFLITQGLKVSKQDELNLAQHYFSLLKDRELALTPQE